MTKPQSTYKYNFYNFPTWDIVVKMFLIYYGIMSFFREDSPQLAALLPHWWSELWSASLALSAVAAIISMWMAPPNGLILHFSSMCIMCGASLSIGLGLAFSRGLLFYPGSTFLYMIAVGTAIRGLQSIRTLNKLHSKSNELLAMERQRQENE